MKKTVLDQSPALKQLLEVLESPATFNPEIKLVIDFDDEGVLTLIGEDAAKVLATVDTINQFHDAVEGDDTCIVEISNTELSQEVLERLEELYGYVDEL